MSVMRVSTAPVHDAGASPGQEIAAALSAGLEYLRWMVEDGLDVSAAATRITFEFPIGSEIFPEIAKLRAARECWARLVAECGGTAAAGKMVIHARTSTRTKTVRNAWLNLLRGTTETFAATVAGADSITTDPLDHARGSFDPTARRLALNTAVILDAESHVSRVVDPAGGSWYVESLTDSLARSAWTLFQELEARGGMGLCLRDGSLAARIEEARRRRQAAIARGRPGIVGVSKYADRTMPEFPAEPPEAQALRAAQAEAWANQLLGHSMPLALEHCGSPLGPGACMEAAIEAARGGATLVAITEALGDGLPPTHCEPLPVHRLAEGFESLQQRAAAHARRTGRPLRAHLICLGSAAEHRSRMLFADGILASGGIETREVSGDTSGEALELLAAEPVPIAVLCGSDEAYETAVPQGVPALRALGALVILAGKPPERAETYAEAGVQVFLHLGGDAVEALEAVLRHAGVEA
jgi:methylmalonyl-CoA mutase